MSLYGRYSGVNGFGSMNGHRLGQAERMMPFQNGGGGPIEGDATLSVKVTVGDNPPINGLAEVYRFENVFGGVPAPILAGRIPLDKNGWGSAEFNLPRGTRVRVTARADNAMQTNPPIFAEGTIPDLRVPGSPEQEYMISKPITLNLLPDYKPSPARFIVPALGIGAIAYLIFKK